MIISLIIADVSLIVWYFPAVKQRHTDLFYYFYFTALVHPLRLYLYYFGWISVVHTELPAAFLILASLFLNNNRWFLFAAIPVEIILYFISKIISMEAVVLLKLLLYILILLYFTRELIIKILDDKVISIFFTLLIILALSILLKNITVLTDIRTGEIYFYVTTAFQLILGLYFSIFAIHTHDIKLSVRK